MRTQEYSAEALEMTFAWLGEKLGYISSAQNFTNCFQAHYTSPVDYSEHTFYFPPVHEHDDIEYPVFPGDEDYMPDFPEDEHRANSQRSYLEIEQEMLDNGASEDELSRFYPNSVGNGHSDVCLCPECAPYEYIDCEYEGPDGPILCASCGNEVPHPVYARKNEETIETVPFRQACLDARIAAFERHEATGTWNFDELDVHPF